MKHVPKFLDTRQKTIHVRAAGMVMCGERMTGDGKYFDKKWYEWLPTVEVR